jgi:Peptidase S24-like
MPELSTPEAVLAAMPPYPGTATPARLAEAAGRDAALVRTAVRRLAERGRLVEAPEYGAYHLPPPGAPERDPQRRPARSRSVPADVPTVPARADRLPAPYQELWELTVYTHVRASAGPGLFGWEPSEDGDVLQVSYSKRLIAELLGFVPPPNTRAIRVDGWSMKRPNGGIDSGQIVLYQPVEQIASGRRHILGVLEEGSEDVRILVKRVQAFIGGGLKIIADNRAAGIEDEVLLPTESGALMNERTKRVARVGVLGTLLWPSEYEDEQTIRTVNVAIERLIAEGFLNDPSTFRAHGGA